MISKSLIFAIFLAVQLCECQKIDQLHYPSDNSENKVKSNINLIKAIIRGNSVIVQH